MLFIIIRMANVTTLKPDGCQFEATSSIKFIVQVQERECNAQFSHLGLSKMLENC